MIVTFELTDADLQHFRLIMERVLERTGDLSPESVIEKARELLQSVSDVTLPGFVADRLGSLELLLQMLEDAEWDLPPVERRRVLHALSYFCEPEDLIPDDVPALGFFDDAIMIELVVRELRHEIEAYKDFCAFRSREEKRRLETGEDQRVTRGDWLDARRRQLHSRMRRRRRKDRWRKVFGKFGRSDAPE